MPSSATSARRRTSIGTEVPSAERASIASIRSGISSPVSTWRRRSCAHVDGSMRNVSSMVTSPERCARSPSLVASKRSCSPIGHPPRADRARARVDDDVTRLPNRSDASGELGRDRIVVEPHAAIEHASTRVEPTACVIERGRGAGGAEAARCFACAPSKVSRSARSALAVVAREALLGAARGRRSPSSRARKCRRVDRHEA